MADRNTGQNYFSTSTFRRREPKEHQYLTRENNKPYYSVEEVHSSDWGLFVWLASLIKIEIYIHLFVVVWDSIPLQSNMQEYCDDTDKMIQLIKDLTSLKALNIDMQEIHIKTLENYRHYRLSNIENLRKNLVNNIWIELEEKYGLKQFSYAFEDQLHRLNFKQKMYLRKIIFARMTSFCSVAKKVYDEGEMKSLIKDNESLKNQIETLKKANSVAKKVYDEGEMKSLIKDNESLKNQIETLKKENARQQAALGNLTNVSWDEENPNNTTKLISDIEELQDALSDFTMVQGSDYKINDLNAAVLLKTSGCQAKYPSTEAKLALGALLQSYTINIILDDVQRYFKHYRSSFGDISLESHIVDTTDRLIKYMENFGEHRIGKDDITKITPVKIRQHAYSALSCRGFYEHPLIKEVASKLLNELNRFREVVDEETNNELHEQAIQITRRVIDIFCFRFKTQAPEPTFQFFTVGQDVDTRFMQGAFGREEAKKLEVEACGFPFIGILGDDRSIQKVFTKAQVITRPKRM